MSDRVTALLCALFVLACEAPTADDVAVGVAGVQADAANNLVLLLEETEGERVLPIWIGIAEAQSIAAELEQIEFPRPNTHDLANHLVQGLGGRLERVVVTELRGNTYFALLVVQRGGDRIEIDSRPSDAIAIALRAQVPIFVREDIFGATPRETALDDDAERLRL